MICLNCGRRLGDHFVRVQINDFCSKECAEEALGVQIDKVSVVRKSDFYNPEDEDPKYEMRRMNIRVSPFIHDWFQRKSKRTGCSMSSLIYLALEEHIKQTNMAEIMPDLMRKVEEWEQSGMMNVNSSKSNLEAEKGA